MKNLLNTNTNEYKENFKKEFESNLYKDENAPQNINQFMKCFDNEANFENNKKRIPNLQNRLADYLQGMPYGFNMCYSEDFIEFAKATHKVEEISEKHQKVIVKNFYGFCANMLLKLTDKKIIQSLY